MGVDQGRAGLFAFNLDQRSGDIAQQSNGDLAVQIHVLDEPGNVGVAGINRKTHQRRVPNTPGLAQLVELPSLVKRIRFDGRGR